MDTPSLFLSSITVYELQIGATSTSKIEDVRNIISAIPVLPFGEDAAIVAANIYQDLKSRNLMIEFRDIFIAATCLQNGQDISTMNIRHFKRISGLTII